VTPEVIVAESNNSLAALALQDLVHFNDEFVETAVKLSKTLECT
jgi:hypothetical protein